MFFLSTRPCFVHFPDEPRAWWFEIFETFRRICLTSLVYFAAATTSQLWMAMLITVVRQQSKYRPENTSILRGVSIRALFVGRAACGIVFSRPHELIPSELVISSRHYSHRRRCCVVLGPQVSLAMNVVYSPFAGSVNDYIYSAAQYVVSAAVTASLENPS